MTTRAKHFFMSVLICFLILSGLFSGVLYAEEWNFSLDESLERALEENRDIQIAKQRLLELYGLRGEALATGLPQITGGAGYQRTFKRPEMFINGQPFRIGADYEYSASVTANQLLWDGGKVIHAVNAAKLEELRGIETIKDAQAQIKLQVKQTFYEILYTDKTIDVLGKQLKVLKEHLSSIKVRYNQGIDSDYTLMRQEVEVSNVEPYLIDAKRKRELLINGMKVLLVIPRTDNFEPMGEFDYRAKAIPQINELVEKSIDNRPDLKADRLREKSLRQNIGIEKSGWWPNLNLKFQYQFQGQSDNWGLKSATNVDSLIGGIALSWPIFDGLKTASRVKQARAKFIQQQLTNTQFEDNVVREVKNSYATLMRARESLQTQQKSLNLARRATIIAGERFEAGLASQLELNDTINAQSKAEELFLQSAFECYVAEATLEKAVGGNL